MNSNLRVILYSCPYLKIHPQAHARVPFTFLRHAAGQLCQLDTPAQACKNRLTVVESRNISGIAKSIDSGVRAPSGRNRKCATFAEEVTIAARREKQRSVPPKDATGVHFTYPEAHDTTFLVVSTLRHCGISKDYE